MSIPTVDLSPFFKQGEGAEDGLKKAMQTVKQACSEYGFFQIANHGVPLDLMSRALHLSKTFFSLPDEEKLKLSPDSAAPLPAGYNKRPANSADKNEYLIMFEPHCGFNNLPNSPPDFRNVLEEIFVHFRRTAEVIETIVNQCLGLPHGFLKEYNDDRSWDFMIGLRYFPATESENNGLSEHEDGNILTLLIQDEVGGLQVKKNGEMIPVVPAEDTIVVNIGDCIQVMSNNKFKSATHRVVRSEARSRHSLAFFYTIKGDKWIEPLSHFTKEIGEKPNYRGFLYKDYQAMRLRNKTHPIPDDIITISHYQIN